MVRFRISNLARRPALAAVLRYGLAFASVAAALGLSLILVHFGLPRLFGAFSCAAIAIAFWCGGTGPGILSVLLANLAFFFFLFPVTEVRGPGWQSFLAIYAIFLGFVGWFSGSRRRAERLLAEARDNLEKRVAERTSELARANEELQSSEDALRHSEDHLRLVIDTVPALIHTGRPDGYLDYFNQRWLDYVGLSLEEVAGWKWTEVNHLDDVAATAEKWRRSIATGEPFEDESRLRRADGEYRWMLHRTVPLRDDRGNIVKWYGSSVDIEDRKRAEEELRRSEQLYSKLVNSVDCIVWEADARTFQFSFVSPQAERILGYPVEQWLTPEFWVEHLHPDDREWCEALCKQAAAEGRDHALEYRMVAADGQAIWLRDVVSVQMGPDGPARLTGVMFDVTRRKLAETAAKESGERFRLVFERSTAGMMITGASGEIIRANKAFCDFLGYSEDGLKGRTILDITDPEDAAKTLAYLEEAKQHKAPSYDLEKRYVHKNGEIVWGRASAISLLPEGRPACWIAVVLDITERKRAEDDLRRQKEVLQKIFDNAPVMIAFLAPDAKLSLVNREWERTLGWSLADMRAHDLNDLLAEFYPDPQLRQEAIAFMSSPSPKFADLSVRARDGQVIETSWGKVRLSDGTEIYIGRDITERKRAEEALRASEERYRNFISHSSEGVWRVELERPLAVGLPEEESLAWLQQYGYIAECNDAFAQIIGSHCREEVEGKSLRDLLPASDEERIESFRSAARGGWRSRTIEFQGRDLAGNLKHVLRMEVPIVENGKLARIWGLTRDITELKRAEEALRRSEDRLRLIIDTIPTMVWSVRPDGTVDFLNQPWLDYSGLSLEQYIEDPTRPIHPEDVPKVLEKWPAHMAAGEPYEDEMRLRRADGEYRWFLVRTVPLRDERGNIVKWYGSSVDIEDRKRAEQELRQSQDRIRAILEFSPNWIFLKDTEGRYLLVNREVERVFRISQEQINGKTDSELFPPEHAAEYRANDLKVLREGVNMEFEEIADLEDGRHTSIVHKFPLFDTHGNIYATGGVATDITERKQAEEALQASEERFRTLFQSVQAGVVVSGPNAEVLSSNPAARDLLGVTEEQLLGTTSFDLKWKTFYEDGTPCPGPEHPIPRAIATRQPVRNMVLGVDRPARGDRIWLLASAQPQIASNGNVTNVICCFEDITERKRAEEAVRDSEERYRTLFERNMAGVYRTTEGGRILECNQAMANILGFESPQDAKQSSGQANYFSEQERALFIEKLEAEGRLTNFEVRRKRKDGSPVWLLANLSLITQDPGGERILEGTFIDITERKRAEAALRASEERWRSVFENSAIGVALTDLEGYFLAANPVYQRLTGYSEAELRELSFLNITLEEYRETNWTLIAELLEGKRQQFQIEKQYRRKDGSLIWVRNNVSLVPGSESVPRCVMALSEDITERKKGEEALRRSRDELRSLAARTQIVREEERTKVAREIHDELGQALTAIKIDLSSVISRLPAERKAQSASILNLVDATIQSVRRIATELRPIILDELGLVAAVEWACEEFQARTGIKCRWDLPDDDVVIDSERATALFRIFQETLTNVARHAGATEVNVRLAKEDGGLTLEVYDNGRGFSEEQLSVDSSLGILGMRERALLLGGELTISGAAGKGTTVIARIPETSATLPKVKK